MFESDGPCEKTERFNATIVLTSCRDEEFTCQDGLCISMVKRCNKIIDCPNDSTDEENCYMVNYDSTYKKEFAPVTMVENENIEKTTVNVTVELLTILTIDEIDSFFSCQIILHLTWFDQRLLYNNLKQDSNYNTLSKLEINSIWTPKVIFVNTENRDGLQIDDKAQATVANYGNFVLATDDVIDNTQIFKGSENPVTLSRSYKGSN